MLSYVNKYNNCTSIINMCDILITDCENYEQINSKVIFSNFKYYEQYCFLPSELISFKMLQKLNKAFYTNNIFLLKTVLCDIKKQLQKIRKQTTKVLQQK